MPAKNDQARPGSKSTALHRLSRRGARWRRQAGIALLVDSKLWMIGLIFLFLVLAGLAADQTTNRLIRLAAAEHRNVEQYLANWLPRNADSLYAAAAAPISLDWSELQSRGAVPAHYTGENIAGQQWLLLARRAGVNQLELLLTTTGGLPFENRKLPAIAALLDYGAYIGADAPAGMARGVVGGSMIPLSSFGSAGGALEPGRLASIIAFDEGRLLTDYLSRVPLLGADRANRMYAALDMGANDINQAGLVEVAEGVRIGGTAAAGTACPRAGRVTGWNNASGRGLICVNEGSQLYWRAIATVPVCGGSQFLRGDGEKLVCANPPW